MPSLEIRQIPTRVNNDVYLPREGMTGLAGARVLDTPGDAKGHIDCWFPES